MDQDNTPRLLLVGGGHAHVGVLRRLAQRPNPAARVVLITPVAKLIYSGMLPGWIAGHYTARQTQIDLAETARAADVELVEDTLVALDPDASTLRLASGATLDYDVLSLNTGTAGPDLDVASHSADTFAPVKPFDRLIERLTAFETVYRGADRPARVVVVGAGLGGVELALSLAYRFREWPRPPQITLMTGASGLLARQPASARRRLAHALRQAAIDIIGGRRVVAHRTDRLILDDGQNIAIDIGFMATGATAPDWIASSGLATNRAGFAEVDWMLRSRSHPRVFVAGDLAALPLPRPKSGVLAVREAPTLAENLMRAAESKALVQFRAPRRALALVSLGDRRAVAIRGRWSLPPSRVLWLLKHWIDRRFIKATSFDQRSVGKD